ncbi:GNAT family N-acetyltransferase [Paenibacillus sp. NPDC056579]|uniref:GNAT family N-acetyltransferase n=1 Tax=Paenibacillus sp. NPDC056579 TaxID=3345871 RepID=UPI0036C17A09
MNYRLREAALHDAKELIVLRRQLDDVHAEARPDLFVSANSYSERSIETYLAAEKTKVIVAEPENGSGELVAYMILNKELAPAGPVFRTPRLYLYVNDLCVKDTYRRQGIGASLMEYAIRYARDIGASSLELNVAEFNSDAIRLYESYGLTTRNRRMELQL